MRKPSEKKSALKRDNHEKLLAEIAPKNVHEKAIEELDKVKEQQRNKSKAVKSIDYGFKGKEMTLFVAPGTPKNKIIEKFHNRYKSSGISYTYTGGAK